MLIEDSERLNKYLKIVEKKKKSDNGQTNISNSFQGLAAPESWSKYTTGHPLRRGWMASALVSTIHGTLEENLNAKILKQSSFLGLILSPLGIPGSTGSRQRWWKQLFGA